MSTLNPYRPNDVFSDLRRDMDDTLATWFGRNRGLAAPGGDDEGLDNLDLESGIEDDKDEGVDTSGGADDTPIVKFVNKVLLDAIKRGASDIHFEPYETVFRVRFRMDGILRPIASPPVKLTPRIAERRCVLRLIEPASLWIRVRLDQARSGGLAVGLPASIELRSKPGARLSGKVARVEATSDSITEERVALVALATVSLIDFPPPAAAGGAASGGRPLRELAALGVEPVWDENGRPTKLRLVPLEQLVIGADTGLRLRLAGARARRDPLALARDGGLHHACRRPTQPARSA